MHDLNKIKIYYLNINIICNIHRIIRNVIYINIQDIIIIVKIIIFNASNIFSIKKIQVFINWCRSLFIWRGLFKTLVTTLLVREGIPFSGSRSLSYMSRESKRRSNWLYFNFLCFIFLSLHTFCCMRYK